jgi:hypothetical protein
MRSVPSKRRPAGDMAGMAGDGIRGAAGEAIVVGATVIMAEAGDGIMAGTAAGDGIMAGTAGKSRSRPFGGAQITTLSTSSRLISSRRRS